MIMNGKPQIYLLIILGFSLLSSCKKLDLGDEIDPLVGTWRWVYSGTSCANSGPPFGCSETIPSCNEFTLEIKKRGVLVTRENGKKKDKYCIVSALKGTENDISTEFILELEDVNNLMGFYVRGDSMVTANFPFPLRNDAGELLTIHASVFVID